MISNKICFKRDLIGSKKAFLRRVPVNGSDEKASVLPVIDFSGATVSEAKLQLRTAKEATFNHVVHRYLTMYRHNQRQGSANTKSRSEVRGGGKKPYTQKKTGNARRGTSRSPLMPGGAVVFGPKPRDWSITITKKERRLAMSTALQKSAQKMVIIQTLRSLEVSKTKAFVEALQKLGLKPMKEKVVI